MNDISPFDHCPALDGYHCQTNSLAKIFYFHQVPLSEEMILGLGAGMGFIHWQMKGMVFIGGRGNVKNFYHDLGKRVSVKVEVRSTSSAEKAQQILVRQLQQKEPVMLYGDMGLLPWFNLPVDYHFGGHTFVVCGYDGKKRVLASDIDQESAGLKKGFYFPITLEELKEARGSLYRPFPPKNAWVDLDCSKFRPPQDRDIYSSIHQTVIAMLHPPIRNIGINGMRHSAREILKWPKKYEDRGLRMTLFSLYTFIEIGGTGGGCFRYMYSRFLREAAAMTHCNGLEDASKMFEESGRQFSAIGNLFKDAETSTEINKKIMEASGRLNGIADIEEEAFKYLSDHIPGK